MLIEPHDKLVKSVNAKLLGLARSTYYYHYQKQPASDEELVWLRKMDEQYLKTLKSVHTATPRGFCVRE